MFEPAPGETRRFRLASTLVVLSLLLAGLASVGLVPTVTAQVPGEPPSIVGIEYLDADGDAHIDSVRIDFEGDDLDVESIRPGAFTIGGTTAFGCSSIDTTQLLCKTVETSDTEYSLTLRFPERAEFGGLEPLAISYAGGIVDADGDAISTTLPTPTVDLGAPRLVRVYPGTLPELVYHFTQPVDIPEPGQFPSTDPDATYANSICWDSKSSPAETVDDATFDEGENFGTVKLDNTPQTSDRAQGGAVFEGNDIPGGLPGGSGEDPDPDGDGCEDETATLQNADGTPVGNPDDEFPWAEGPSLIGAIASIGSSKVTLVFDGPVSGLSNGAVVASAFSVDTNDGASKTITAIQHVPGSERVVLTLSKPVFAPDIDDTVIQVSDTANDIFGTGTGTSNRVAATDSAPLTDDVPASPSGAAPATVLADFLAADAAPTVVSAKTLDEDCDGSLDAVRVRFDQAVDVSGAQGSDFRVHSGTVTVTPDSVTATSVGTGPCKATAPTTLTSNYLYLNLKAGDKSKFDSGTTVSVSYDGDGVTEVLEDGSTGQDAYVFTNLVAADGAPPVVLGVETADVGGDPSDPTADGRLDALKLRLSEPVQASSFAASSFTVFDKEPDAADGTYAGERTVTSGSVVDAGEDALFVHFATGTDPDTDHLPVIAYDAVSGLTDPAGNKMRAFLFHDRSAGTSGVQPLDHATVDKAVPFVESVVGSVGADSVLMTFSEPVYGSVDGNGEGTGSVPSSAFTYDDRASGNAAGFATGSGAYGHAAGSNEVSFVVNEAFTAADLDEATGDRILVAETDSVAGTSSVYDAAGNNVPPAPVSITTGAPISIVSVETLDLFDASATDGQPQAGDTKSANGLIDTLKIRFSTSVLDGANCANIDVGDWTISLGNDDRTPLFGETDIFLRNPPAVDDPGEDDDDDPDTGADTWSPGSCASRTDRDNGPIVYLIFDEDGEDGDDADSDGDAPWDTATIPTLSYRNDGDGFFIAAKDTGAPLKPTTDFDAVDGAPPVYLRAVGNPGSPTVNLRFSEPVFSPNTGDGRLSTLDLAYDDVNDEGADGVRSVGSRSGNVQPITLVRDLTDEDVDTDRVIIDRPLQDADGNPLRTDDFDGTDQTSKAIEDRSSAILLSAATGDADADGFLDHLKLTFNEDLDGGTACANLEEGDWVVLFDGVRVPVTEASFTVGGGCTETTGSSLHLFFSQDNVYGMTDTNDPDFGVSLHTGEILSVAHSPDGSNVLTDVRGNALSAFPARTTTDGAPPILMDADGSSPGAKPEAAMRDRDGDGIVDAVRLVFSEPMDDSTFNAADWEVADHCSSSSTLCGLETGTPDDEVVFLTFPKGTDADTAALYDVTYDAVGAGLRDLAGTSLADLPTKNTGTDPVTDTGSIDEVDRARPNLDSTVGLNPDVSVGDDTLDLTFSEEVFGNAAGDGFTSTSFAYVNDGTGTDSATAVLGAAYIDGDKTMVRLTLDDTVSQDDIDRDRVEMVSVYDAEGNNIERQFRVNGQPIDTTAPDAVSGLTATGKADTESEGSITLSWTTPGDDDLDRFEIYIRAGAAVDADDLENTARIEDGTVGDAVDPPTPDDGNSQSVEVGGLDPGTTYHFLVRLFDESGNAGDAATASAQVPVPDTTNPDAVTDLTVVATKTNSVTLEWTVPADDTGVTGFEVVHATDDTLDDFSAGLASTVTHLDANGNPRTTVPAAGTAVRALVSGLERNTEYTFAVRAVDAAGNFGDHGVITQRTNEVDLTPPTGTLTVTSSTHLEGSATENTAPAFSWSGLTDDESTITYFFALNQDPAYVVDGTEGADDEDPFTGSGTLASTSFTDVPVGTWTFHVRGQSDGGFHPDTARYTIEIVPVDTPEVTPEDLSAANDGLQDNVAVERDGEDNIVRWTLPDTDLEVAGVQIWRSTSPYELLVDLPSDDPAFAAGEFVDEDAPEAAKYIVTLYFFESATGGKVSGVDNAPGYTGLTEEELQDAGAGAIVTPPEPPVTEPDGGLPWWVWVLLVVGLVGIAAAVIIPVAVGRRRKDDGWDEPAQWDDSTWSDAPDLEDDDAGDDGPDLAAAPGADLEGDDAEEHYIECPKCDHGFEVHGSKPLETTCPNCGVKGVLR